MLRDQRENNLDRDIASTTVCPLGILLCIYLKNVTIRFKPNFVNMQPIRKFKRFVTVIW